jgi:hypothetical protein
VVFLNQAQPFSLKLAGVRKPPKAQWYQPFTGQRRDMDALASGTNYLSPPADWGSGPIALQVGRSGR